MQSHTASKLYFLLLNFKWIFLQRYCLMIVNINNNLIISLLKHIYLYHGTVYDIFTSFLNGALKKFEVCSRQLQVISSSVPPGPHFSNEDNHGPTLPLYVHVIGLVFTPSWIYKFPSVLLLLVAQMGWWYILSGFVHKTVSLFLFSWDVSWL